MTACAGQRPSAAEALQDPYFTGAEAEAEATASTTTRHHAIIMGITVGMVGGPMEATVIIGSD